MMFSQSTKQKEEEAHASKNNQKIMRRQRNLGGWFHSINQVCVLELQLNSVTWWSFICTKSFICAVRRSKQQQKWLSGCCLPVSFVETSTHNLFCSSARDEGFKVWQLWQKCKEGWGPVTHNMRFTVYDQTSPKTLASARSDLMEAMKWREVPLRGCATTPSPSTSAATSTPSPSSPLHPWLRLTTSPTSPSTPWRRPPPSPMVVHLTLVLLPLSLFVLSDVNLTLLFTQVNEKNPLIYFLVVLVIYCLPKLMKEPFDDQKCLLLIIKFEMHSWNFNACVLS